MTISPESLVPQDRLRRRRLLVIPSPGRPNSAVVPSARMTEATRSRWPRARVYLIPVALLVSLGLARLTTGGYKVDTALYLGVANDMVETGRWWTPHAGSVPYFNKPPLVLWLHAVVIELVGPSLVAARLVQIALAAFAVLVTTHIARLLSGPTVGLLTGCMFALTFSVVAHLNRVLLDYAVVALMLAGVMLVVRAWRCDARGRSAALHATGAGIAIGLAMLCKPIFAIIAFPVLALWLMAQQRGRLAAWLGLSAAVACVVAAPWHLSMLHIHGELFESQYFGREIASRTSNREGFGDRPWWTYLWFIVREFHPWQLMLYAMLATLAAAALRPVQRDRLRRHAPAIAFALIWSVAWLVLLSLFGDKRVRYMMHVWPALALLGASWLARLSPMVLRRSGTRSWGRLAAVLVVLGAGGAVAGAIWGTDGPKDHWRPVHAFVRELPADVELWEVLRHPPEPAEIAIEAGRWPVPMVYGSPAEFRPPPAGAVVLLDIPIYDRLAKYVGVEGLPVPGVLLRAEELVAVRWNPAWAEAVEDFADIQR